MEQQPENGLELALPPRSDRYEEESKDDIIMALQEEFIQVSYVTALEAGDRQRQQAYEEMFVLPKVKFVLPDNSTIEHEVLSFESY